MDDAPLDQTRLTDQVNLQAEPATATARPHRQMTDQHRRNLSKSIKKLWARRGGLSSEHRQKISASAKRLWAERGTDVGRTSADDEPNCARSLPEPMRP